ncbi:MAG: hypothetical protein ACR2L6_03270 [Gemmatimonadaceae bacterium]
MSQQLFPQFAGIHMRTQAGAPPAQPATPASPGGPAVIRIEGVPGVPAQTLSVPLSLADVRWLRARRSELIDQLSRADDRREAITDELAGTTGANRAGLEQQLAIVDGRIVQLEAQIAETEGLLTSAPTGFLAAAEPPQYSRGGDSEAWVAVPVILIIFVIFPIVFAYARRIWNRAPAPRVNPAEAGRLERIEQAVEAIAVEVERVSEGQRFVTKLLSDTSRTPVSLPRDS